MLVSVVSEEADADALEANPLAVAVERSAGRVPRGFAIAYPLLLRRGAGGAGGGAGRRGGESVGRAEGLAR